MRINIVPASLLLLFLMPAQISATTYRFTDKDGTVWFTDKKLTQNKHADYTPLNRSAKSRVSVSCMPPGHKALEQRIAKYDPIINLYASRYGVHSGLIHAIISTESCYDADAVSAVGAQGLMQLMPGTAGDLGVSDVFDARQNIRGGTEYFSKLYKEFHYNHEHALAAYNAGPASVRKYKGIPPYRETREYVNKVLAKFRKHIPSLNAFSGVSP